MFRQTSLLAYRSLNKSKINERQKQVLSYLEEIAPANNRQVSELSRLPINVVTPRMGELVRKNLVIEAFRDTDDKTGRRTIFWKPASMNTQECGEA